MTDPFVTTVSLALTDHARRVLELAQAYAAELGHHYIGTEHILVGLLREERSIGQGVLYSMGIEREKVEQAVEFIVGASKGPGE